MGFQDFLEITNKNVIIMQITKKIDITKFIQY